MHFNWLRKVALVSAVLGVFYTSPAEAKEFTGADVLAWEVENQNWYFQTSVTMAAFIATRTDQTKSTCINDWYFDRIDERNRHMRETITKFRDYHPSGTILAIIEKACGSFGS